MSGLFVIWLVGVFVAYLYYSGQGERDEKYPHDWTATYTGKQQLAFSLTWVVWSTRALVRGIIWLIVWFLLFLMDLAIHVWHKWLNE